MQTRRLGRTDLTIAPIVLGGNVFGWTADKTTSFAVLDRFAASGAAAIDTADAYSAWVPGNRGGELETIIGEWMKARGNRNRVVVITKVGSPMGKGKEGLSPAYIEEAVEASLRRLQTDVIDLYLSHWPDMATPIADTLGAYQRLIEKGKIRWCGGSNLTATLLEQEVAAAKARGGPRYEVLQPEYNLADRASFENGLRRPLPTRGDRRHHLLQPGEGLLDGQVPHRGGPRQERARIGREGLSEPARFRHPRRPRGRRGDPQGQARRGCARLGRWPAPASPRRSPAPPRPSRWTPSFARPN